MSSELFGWNDDQDAVTEVLGRQQFPLMSSTGAAEGILGAGEGKVVLLYESAYKVLGGRDRFNIRTQAIGDCVSMGAAGAVDILRCIQAANGIGEWVAETCTEAIYGASRVEIGKGRLGNGDGSVGAWAAEACKKYGTLVRIKYSDKYDLTKYSGQRAKEWGGPRAGLPDELEPAAREHLVETVSLVTTYKEARAALASGYTVTIASQQGFSNVRDKDGFAKPQGSWPHQMFLMAVDDAFGRPGCLCMNSWGPRWISGPIRHNQPEGSFWIDADVLEKRILSKQDSWAFSEYKGFPPKKVRLDWGSVF